MPTYVYGCPQCDARIEIVRKITDPENMPDCPARCMGTTMIRVISASAFVLKGSGWAKDGYTGGKK